MVLFPLLCINKTIQQIIKKIYCDNFSQKKFSIEITKYYFFAINI